MKRYSLNIDGICEFNISGDKASGTWLNNFARILELKENEIFHKDASSLHFRTIKSKYTKPALICRKGDQKDKWQLEDLKIIKFWQNNELKTTILEMEDIANHEIDIIKMWTALYPLYNKALESGGLPFHATLLELNKKGVLIVAQGGKGKSTCAKRIPSPWRALSDDEALVFYRDNSYFAHPFPTWSDYLLNKDNKTWAIEKNEKLFGIFFLEHGEDEVIPLSETNAVMRMVTSANEVYSKFMARIDEKTKRETRVKIFSNACRISKKIPAYTLKAELDGRFWEKIGEVI